MSGSRRQGGYRTDKGLRRTKSAQTSCMSGRLLALAVCVQYQNSVSAFLPVDNVAAIQQRSLYYRRYPGRYRQNNRHTPLYHSSCRRRQQPGQDDGNNSILKLLNVEIGMGSRNGNTEPDKGQQWIWQPVHPAEIAQALIIIQVQIHPDIEKFVYAKARYEVLTEPVGFQVFSGNVEIAFKWRDSPAERAFRQQ